MRLIRKLFPAAIVVLGMHRSGTSSLIGSLQNRGLYLGQVNESNRFNIKGNRENPLIVDLNTSILRYNSAEWSAPPVHSIKWTNEHVMTARAIVKSFARAGFGHWGFKDPRTLLVLPFWESILKRCRYAGTVRHPTLVARSLQNRNKFTIEHGLNLWREYNLRLLGRLRRSPFPVISFDAEPDRYVSSVDMIGRKLGLEGRPDYKFDYYDRSLVSQQRPDLDSLPDEIRRIYTGILEYVV